MNSVFCLSLMSINTEAGIEKLLEYADAIRERLQESPELKQYLIDKLMTKFAMFILNKPELKQPIEDLRFRLLGNDLEYAQLGLLSASQPKLAKSASKKSAPPKKAGEDQVMRDESSRKRGREEISREGGGVLNFDASLGQAAGRPVMQAKRGATGPPNRR
ncbi:hypothetical protein FGO68_gene4359 [Halteria grandinella]|uniref:Uncharacterized protein n=1 Tax=Halteria grandinella TaxID=5974 RepID=A0A8J8P2D9_HALGN|nr:hypothetical protein FGO68_gene4359 [Halteria grandinella]